jgi:ribosomal RNA-processing protein 9
VVRLWRLADAKGGSSKALEPVGGLPVRGFVNGLALGRSGRLLVAGLGQEPRMGRWLRDSSARNGVLVQPLSLQPEGGE